jgi:hypothetical protein
MHSTGLTRDEKKRLRGNTPRRDPEDVSPPRFGRIPTAKARSGLSRSELYEMAAEHRGLFLKRGSATIVNLDDLAQGFAADFAEKRGQRCLQVADQRTVRLLLAVARELPVRAFF